jgi:hypothetical protein
LYCESSEEGWTYRFSSRSRSSSNNSVDEFIGFDDEEDMVFTFHQPDFYGSLREETADSESFTSKVYYDSENFSPPFCRDNSTSTTKMSVPDDAQSSTSDSCCCCCDSCDYDDEYEDDDSDEDELSSSASTSAPAPAQSFINYLFEASDDDLGLIPVHCRYDLLVSGLSPKVSHMLLSEPVVCSKRNCWIAQHLILSRLPTSLLLYFSAYCSPRCLLPICMKNSKKN